MVHVNVFQIDVYDEGYEPNETDDLLRALSDIVDTPPAATPEQRQLYDNYAFIRGKGH